jgi:cell division protein ZapA (FtsZ GTPase activity inhibitor)
MPDPNHGPSVQITIDGKFYDLHSGTVSVHALKKLASIFLEDRLDQDINSVVTELDQAGNVLISGGEVFVSFPATVEIVVNGKGYNIKRGKERVSAIKDIAGVPQEDRLDQDIESVLTPLDQDGAVTITGGEVFVSFPSKVEIIVDGKAYKIKRGNEPVSAIKSVASVPAAYQLDQDINGVLTPLDQNGTVNIKGGEVFVSYPAAGSSS